VKSSGGTVFDRRYSPDWTGVAGATDLTAQLKYSNPPADKTLLAYCTWHTATAGAPTFTALSMSGSARKVDYNVFLEHGPNAFNRP
jgi:hypothetical protein